MNPIVQDGGLTMEIRANQFPSDVAACEESIAEGLCSLLQQLKDMEPSLERNYAILQCMAIMKKLESVMLPEMQNG